MRGLALVLFVAALVVPSSARADDVSSAARGVVRVVVVVFDEWGDPIGLGHGSGFAVAPHRVVTNAHVLPSLAGDSSLVVNVIPGKSGKRGKARVIHVDRSKDLALLETSARLAPLTLYGGTISDGRDVVALGYPGNVDRATVNSFDDYISPRDPVRSQGNYSNSSTIENIDAVLHTAAIARGSSGGPLVDECGRVLGVNSFTTTSGNGDAPFTFAIAGQELRRFLRSAGEDPRVVVAACLSAAERAASEEAQAARTRERESEARHDRQIGSLQEQQQAALLAQRIEQNWIGIAVILGGIGLISVGAGGLLYARNRPRGAAAFAVTGLMMILGGAGVFFARPNPALAKADNVPLTANFDASVTNTAEADISAPDLHAGTENIADEAEVEEPEANSRPELTADRPNSDMNEQLESTDEPSQPINYAEGL